MSSRASTAIRRRSTARIRIKLRRSSSLFDDEILDYAYVSEADGTTRIDDDENKGLYLIGLSKDLKVFIAKIKDGLPEAYAVVPGTADWAAALQAGDEDEASEEEAFDERDDEDEDEASDEAEEEEEEEEEDGEEEKILRRGEEEEGGGSEEGRGGRGGGLRGGRRRRADVPAYRKPGRAPAPGRARRPGDLRRGLRLRAERRKHDEGVFCLERGHGPFTIGTASYYR